MSTPSLFDNFGDCFDQDIQDIANILFKQFDIYSICTRYIEGNSHSKMAIKSISYFDRQGCFVDHYCYGGLPSNIPVDLDAKIEDFFFKIGLAIDRPIILEWNLATHTFAFHDKLPIQR